MVYGVGFPVSVWFKCAFFYQGMDALSILLCSLAYLLQTCLCIITIQMKY